MPSWVDSPSNALRGWFLIVEPRQHGLGCRPVGEAQPRAYLPPDLSGTFFNSDPGLSLRPTESGRRLDCAQAMCDAW
jgi:hypothetical protein